MKPILIVISLFLVVSLGLGVYFVSVSQKTLNDAAFASGKSTKILSDVVSDCDLFFTSECKNTYTSMTVDQHMAQIQQLLAHASNPEITRYTEEHSAMDAPDLLPSELLPKKLSIAQMIQLVSQRTGVSELALIMMLQIRQPIFTQSDLHMESLFGAPNADVLSTLSLSAQELLTLKESTVDTQWIISSSRYQCDQDCSSASLVLYTYMSHHVKQPIDFEILTLKENQSRPTNIFFMKDRFK